MRKTKRFIGYLSYIIIVAFILKTLMQYELVLVERTQATYDSFPSLLYSTIYPMFLGMLFALPSLVEQIKIEGRWTFDWVKGIALGLPALFGTTIFLTYFSPIGIYLPFKTLLMFGTKFSTICGIAFGYLALSSFRKSKVNF
ncbi:hypothetical protein AN963_10285 [Brevibacillus choshinensis]|uniref:Permease n=1 Tax=Brevibacillus choshinensis TaxID=54911 RepID=A0ABR5NF98_BRECH|nr:hypothetical protein AN963_10285 [Brevibacillus choshinensis]